MRGYNEVNINQTHPNMFRSVLTFGLINCALGLNFIFTKPTFNPYEIDKGIIGAIFLALGISKIIFLLLYRNLKAVRFVMFLEIVFMIFWGIGTSITFFQGKTSLQLFVLYAGLAAIETFLLLEPAVNPVTKKSNV